ncbi:hypothetical protein BGZ65_007858 [Modicella reniformis]|uniref:PH domain-containing protein n=1 Tax=Modicella reniformis TaxID=1440133 RepID=A0A9P6MK87_9FUNG|nr:hypothetical protein BGZ65_007858 [Modicella reniformis]
MQNDTFKRFSRDLQDALVMPASYLSKKTKKTTLGERRYRPPSLARLTFTKSSYVDIDEDGARGVGGLEIERESELGTAGRGNGVFTPRSDSTSDCDSLHNFSLSTISKTSYDDNHSFTSSNGSTTEFLGISQQHLQQLQQQQQQHPISIGKRSRASSFLKSPLSPGAFGIGNILGGRGFGGGGSCVGSFGGDGGRIYPDLADEPALVHCPVSVTSLDQFSPERHAWVKECLNPNSNHKLKESPHLNDVLKSEKAWNTVEGNRYEARSSEELAASIMNFSKTGYNNLNEATGLLLVKLIQFTNRATSKIFDLECTLRVGGVERASHPSRSFKDNPGNTATMNEIFLFDVDKSFQLELEVTGTPVATKFGTMAGFCNTQMVHLGRLVLSLPLDSMAKSIRTYKLQRMGPADAVGHQLPGGIKIQPRGKADCEIVIMLGVHVLQEPIEDRSWETEVLYQCNLTIMTRGARMGSWKRYWVVLEGSAVKLYDAEYQLKRVSIATISLAFIQKIQPPDYDKVDVSSNGFSLVVIPSGVDMSNASEFDLSDMDYNVYAFTDSAYLHDCWTANLEEALDQYRENMAKRSVVERAKRDRLRRGLVAVNDPVAATNSSQIGSTRPSTATRAEDDESERPELIDLKFVS